MTAEDARVLATLPAEWGDYRAAVVEQVMAAAFDLSVKVRRVRERASKKLVTNETISHPHRAEWTSEETSYK
jgi:hypothetical protein